MSTPADNGDRPDALSVHENAQDLLLALYNADDHRASTSDLKKPTGLSASNISGRHAKTVIREGWAEKVGSEDVGARSEANVYELTHRGKREANLLLKRKPVPMSEEDRTLMVQQLRDRVEELEEQVDENSEELEEHNYRLNSIDTLLETAIDRIAEVREKV